MRKLTAAICGSIETFGCRVTVSTLALLSHWISDRNLRPAARCIPGRAAKPASASAARHGQHIACALAHLVLGAALGAGSVPAFAANGHGPFSKAARLQAPKGQVPVFIQLDAPPAVVSYAQAMGEQAPDAVKRLHPVARRAAAVSSARAQMAANADAQKRVMSSASKVGIAATELYRIGKAMNGVAAYVDPADIAQLRTIDGVKAVRIIEPSRATSSGSVPFVGAPAVWQGGAIPQADGTAVKIGIIDSGIDYLHADFGGSGSASDYAAIDPASLSGSGFPTAKVVGGVDLAGDDYDGKNLPVPDPNPIDCDGHGTHVAGTAAGFGVANDGTTYAGPYGGSVPGNLRIQPGVAPKALLYAIRIFGCVQVDGSLHTQLVMQGIDWALDPNGDGNIADHLDVINLSLGSERGGLTSLDQEAANNAAMSGMIVVAAAMNSGDSYMIAGTPGNGSRVISVAATLDSGESASKLTVNAPPAIAGDYRVVPAKFAPTLSSTPLTGVLVYAIPNDGCAPFTNAAAVAGKIAVVDRGTCYFDDKANNAQLAGAIAVVVVDNQFELLYGVGSGAGWTISIPTVMVGKTDGRAIAAQLNQSVTGSLAGGFAATDSVASFSSRGPALGLPASLKPDLAAPGVNIVSAMNGRTANGIVAGSQPATMDGTSMATPHVAGLMALLRQLHPAWTVEELKALAMNTATHDLTTDGAGAGIRYGAGRVGAGRIDAANAARSDVVAYNADGSGAVSLSFPGEIVGSTTFTRKIHVINHGTSSATFSLSIDTVVDNPGIAFSLPGGSSVTLAPGAATDIDVRMSGVANQVTHTHDPTIMLQQTDVGGMDNWRQYLTEETAYVNFSAAGTVKLRVPLFVAPYPASEMSAGSSIPTGGAASGSGSLTLAGNGICTGSMTAGTPPTCAATFPLDEKSFVTPFELQVINPRNSSVPARLDIQYAGLAYDPSDTGYLHLGLSTWGPWSIWGLSGSESIQVTLRDPTTDAPTFTLVPGWQTDDYDFGLDVYGTWVYDHANDAYTFFPYANFQDGNGPDTRIFQNSVMFLTAPLDWIGLTSTSTVKYSIQTLDSDGLLRNSIGPMIYHLGAAGLDFAGAKLLDDLPGATIPFSWNVNNLITNKSFGGLLLHHHNKAGTAAEALYLPLSATRLSIRGQQSQTATIGTGFSKPLQVVALDELGLPHAGILVQFALPAAGAGGTFAGGGRIVTVQTDANGVATAPAVTANLVAGSYQAMATASGLAGTSFNLTNLTGAAASLTANAGTPQIAQVGSSYPVALQVMVRDAGNNAVPGIVVTFTAPLSGAGVTFAGGVNTAVSDQNGVATSRALTANGIAGAFVVTASIPGVTSSVSFALANVVGVSTLSGMSGTQTGTASAHVSGNGWLFAPTGSGALESGGFIALSGHSKSPPNAPEGIAFPHGLFDFVLLNGVKGSQATVTLTLPQPLPPGVMYWKYGPTPAGYNCNGTACATPHWYIFPNAVISGNTITLTIADGGVGDDDLTANGTIVDQGGPGVLSGPRAIPALDANALAALSILLVLMAGVTRKKSDKLMRKRI